MTRKALIIWGGWAGHFPEQGAQVLADMLAEDGFAITLTPDYAAFAEAASHDLVVPVITNDQIEPALVDALSLAVRAGTGLAGYHGGLAASFHGAVRFHYLCGVHWVAHPGDMAAHYRVTVTRPHDPLMLGISDFDYHSEQYYVLYDPSIEILATTTFSGAFDPASRGVSMPVAFKRHFGAGRIFYTALGHSPAELFHPEARLLLRRGLNWAARPNPAAAPAKG
jgi:type 1 glutamine amidotransferase